MNTVFLGIYLIVATITLVNLLVALFATTYEEIQVSKCYCNNRKL